MQVIESGIQSLSILGTLGLTALVVFTGFTLYARLKGRAEMKALEADEAYAEHVNASVHSIRDAGV